MHHGLFATGRTSPAVRSAHPGARTLGRVHPASPSLPFAEKQRPRQWWLWAILGIVGLAGMLSAIDGGGFSDPTQRAWATAGLLAGLLVVGAIAAGFLHVQVDTERIEVAYMPFFRKRYPTRGIVRAQPRTMKPMREYGGWGIRRSALGNGWAYTVDGHEGVQIEFDDGRRVFLGSRKPEELAAAIRNARGLD